MLPVDPGVVGLPVVAALLVSVQEQREAGSREVEAMGGEVLGAVLGTPVEAAWAGYRHGHCGESVGEYAGWMKALGSLASCHPDHVAGRGGSSDQEVECQAVLHPTNCGTTWGDEQDLLVPVPPTVRQQQQHWNLLQYQQVSASYHWESTSVMTQDW